MSSPPAVGAQDFSTPILVLRRSFGELQHAVLSLARTAGRLGIPVYAVRASARELATQSRYLRGAFPAPPGTSPEQWLDALVEFGFAHGRPVLVAIDDDSAAFADEHHATLSAAFRMVRDPAGLHSRLASKHGLWQLCKQLDLPTPNSSFPASEAEAAALAERYTYPVVLKRSEHWRQAADPDAPSVLIARNPNELLYGYRRMESRGDPNVVVQEYIPGGPETVWMFNGYFDRGSECLCAFTGQKLRQRGQRTGPTTLGICIWNEAVAELATRLMSGLAYHGIVDMGVRYDTRDGQYKVLDVNPRLGSSFRLFVDHEGLDVVRAAYLDLTGQPVRMRRPLDGRKWVVEPYDLVASAQEIRRKTLTLSGWIRSLSGIREAAWWARDDPLPFFGMCASLGWKAVRYNARRRRRRRAEKRAASGPPPNTESCPQATVNRYFGQGADYWRVVYDRHGLQALIYRERMQTVLRWIEDLHLPPGALALEVGCGAGLLAAELATRGLQVTATDSSIEMVKKAQQRAHEVGVADAMSVDLCDAHKLPFASQRFDLVVALGVLPWLHDPQSAIDEMVRVLRPGGWVALTADNRARLNCIVEPRENPLLYPVKVVRAAAKRTRERVPNGAPSQLHLPAQVELMLRSAGVSPRRRTTIGFGPFTLLGRVVLPDTTGLRVHRWLQRISEHRAPAVRRLGWHYLVCAQKPEPPPARIDVERSASVR
ncbi:MAG TPA: methyltransferase domain-containing protein [Solirubrobacteraceae bacterium]|nr:methyltransferase domain-containing protein [Solirubrobacteraceae bacterium]